ncbi:ABC transporter substrate-binding protein [Pseudomonas purpurea]
MTVGLSTLALGTLSAEAATSLRVALNADIRSTEPGVNRDENTDAVILHVVEGLVAYREDASVGPLLASKVQVSDDGLEYRFILRDGVKFHNGATLTAADVLWTWKRYLDPATQWRCLADFDGRSVAKVVDISAPDPLTVVFRLSQPNGLFLAQMARSDCGGTGIVHPASADASGKWQAPIGTGPFKFTEWKPGQYVDLQRFADYSARPEPAADGYTGNKQAFIDDLRFMVIPDAASAKAALQSKGVDVLPDVTVMDARELSALPGIKTSSSSNMSLNALLFQTRDPLLKDVRIRRAIALSLDSEHMVQALTEGTSHANNSAVPDTSPYYTDVQKQGFKANIEEAKRLLKEAGYHGQPLKIITNKRYQSVFDMAVLSQAMAQASGLNIDIETLEWGTQLERYQSGAYQIMAFSYSARFDAALNFESIMGDKNQQPRKVWDNPEAQGWMLESMRERDPVKRQALFNQLHHQLLEDVPMVVMYNGSTLGAFQDKVQGYRSWPIAKPRLWGVKLAE